MPDIEAPYPVIVVDSSYIIAVNVYARKCGWKTGDELDLDDFNYWSGYTMLEEKHLEYTIYRLIPET